MRYIRLAPVAAGLLLAACAHPTTQGAPAAASTPACSLSATVPGALVNQPPGSNWPPAEPPRAGVSPLTMARAIAAAESYQVASTRNMNAPAVAVEEGYAQAQLDAGTSGGDPDIAPDRCTWVVKVTAPFQPDYAPYPTAPRVNPRYTVLFDVASGVMETLTSPPS